ncbi:MAG: hypothetical protein AB4041_10145 [Microcystaceae cyanobacterium]
MERGLLWLPLLIFFISLAWIGLREYQKVEAYQTWSKNFDKAKYDIYAVLGQKGRQLTWGKPNQGEPIDLVTFSLDDVQEILLSVDDHIIASASLPDKGKPSLLFRFIEEKPSINIPFTDISLANKWLQYLKGL